MSPRASAAAARPLPHRAPAARPELTAIPGGGGRTRPRLDGVRAPLTASTAGPLLVLCGLLIVGALLTALILNTTMARGSYEMSELRQQVGTVAQDTQTLQGQIRAAEASLPERARALGMVEAPAPQLVRLSDTAAEAEVKP